MRGGRLGFALAAVAAAAVLADAALAQAIVVRSTGPTAGEYPKGKRLAAGAAVKLEAGDTVVVLDQAGTRVLKGKGAFTIDGKVLRDRGMISLLSRSLSNPQTIRAGAVRGAGGARDEGEPIASSVWLADIDRGGRVCLPRGSDLYLWRANSGERRFTWLGAAEGGEMVRLLWPSKTSGIAWPNVALPLVAGRGYRLNEDGNPDRATDFELIMLEPASAEATAEELAATLLDKGCAAQFDVLAATLERIEGVGAE